MSVELMGRVWRCGAYPTVQKMVLLALADHGHDDGSSIWPSVGALAAKTGASPRTVQYALRDFEADGVLVLVGLAPRGATREYRIDIARLAQLTRLGRRPGKADQAAELGAASEAGGAPGAPHDGAPEGAPDAPGGCTTCTPGGAPGAPKPSLEPSIEPNPQSPPLGGAGGPGGAPGGAPDGDDGGELVEQLGAAGDGLLGSEGGEAATADAVRWSGIRNALLRELGEATFRSWLGRVALRGRDGDAVQLAAPSRFLRDFVERHYAERLRALWGCAVAVVVDASVAPATTGPPAEAARAANGTAKGVGGRRQRRRR